jgi:hypothetical protein
MDVFWMDFRTNSDGFHTRHELIILHNRECVYCAVRNEFVNTLGANRSLSPRRPGFDSRSLRVRFIVYKVASGKDVFFSTSAFPLSLSFHQGFTLLIMTWCSYQKHQWVKPGNLSKTNALPGIGGHWTEKYFHFLFTSLKS